MAGTRRAKEQVFVVGVGMTKFEKPFTKKWDYPDMAREAGTAALNDAGISYQDVEAVVASYCYGEPTSGQRAVYELGLTGVPVFNTNNNCSSASSGLMLARLLVLSGQYRCVLALSSVLDLWIRDRQPVGECSRATSRQRCGILSGTGMHGCQSCAHTSLRTSSRTL